VTHEATRTVKYRILCFVDRASGYNSW